MHWLSAIDGLLNERARENEEVASSRYAPPPSYSSTGSYYNRHHYQQLPRYQNAPPQSNTYNSRFNRRDWDRQLPPLVRDRDYTAPTSSAPSKLHPGPPPPPPSTFNYPSNSSHLFDPLASPFASTVPFSPGNSISASCNTLCQSNVNSSTQYAAIAKALQIDTARNIDLNADEAFFLRHYVEHVGHTLCTFSMDKFNLEIMPQIALKERVVLDTIIAITSLNICYSSPGLLSMSVSHMYRDRAAKQIHDNMDATQDYNRKLLYFWCYMLILLHDGVVNTAQDACAALRTAYDKLHAIMRMRPESLKRRAHDLGKERQDQGPVDLFMPCACFLYALDAGNSNQTGTASCWPPGYMQSLIDFENQPRMYTCGWWAMKCYILLMEIQYFANDQNVPTLEELQGGARLRRWHKIYNSLAEFGRNMPQMTRTSMVLPKYAAAPSSFPKIVAVDDFSLQTSVLHHAAWIMLHLSRPDMTEDELNSVPPECLEHAKTILGLLSCCEDPIVWMSVFWAHGTACICLEDPEIRDEAAELSRQYDWVTGYLFNTHWDGILRRWNQLDAHKANTQARRAW